MAKAQEKLTPVPAAPKPRKSPARAPAEAPAPAGMGALDLSHIVEGLRPLAVAIDSLQFDPANPRLHSEDNLAGIKGSLRVYGQRKPVVVNKRTGAVEAGNGTLAAALSLNWTHIAAVFVDDDGATAAGYSIADNRSAELAEWDKPALEKLLHEVNTGNDEQLDAMLSKLAEEQKLIPADGDGETASDQSGDLKPAYNILIVCKTEAEQGKLLERFAAEGLDCRSLIS